MKNKERGIHEFTWTHQRKKLYANDFTIAESWLMSRKDVGPSSRSNWGTALISFTEYLIDDAYKSNLLPTPGTSIYQKFAAWKEEVKKLEDLAQKHVKRMGRLKTTSAEVNKSISNLVDEGRREEEQLAIHAMQHGQYYKNLVNQATKVPLLNPARTHFTNDLFIKTGHTCAIILLLTNGQRPECARYITVGDVWSIQPNKQQQGLYVLNVQQYEVEKSGKTATETRLGLDVTLYKLLLHYVAMRQIILFPHDNGKLTQDSKLFFSLKGKQFFPSTLRKSNSWKGLGLPHSLTFVRQRAVVTTEFKQVFSSHPILCHPIQCNLFLESSHCCHRSKDSLESLYLNAEWTLQCIQGEGL